MNDNGEERLPVIYVVAADGETIDVGVQADVAAATVDIADVRFADESADAFDDGVDDEPVIADGVMLLIGATARSRPRRRRRRPSLPHRGELVTVHAADQRRRGRNGVEWHQRRHGHVGDRALIIPSAKFSACTTSRSLTT